MNIGPLGIYRRRSAATADVPAHWSYHVIVQVTRRTSLQLLVLRFDKP